MKNLPVAALALASLLVDVPLPAQEAQVRHGPAINAKVEGSVQVMTAEDVTLNGGAQITGSLFLPGTPSVRLNGNPVYGGTLDGTGSAAPTNHRITLNGNAKLGHVVRRTDPAPLPTVAPPQSPTGTRSVTLKSSTQTPGDYATLRDLTLDTGAGQIAVPPGAYGAFTARQNTGFILGTPGATTAAVYSFQRLDFDGNATLQVLGPVLITVREDLTTTGALGSSAHPEWLALRLSAGSLTLNGGATVYAHAQLPAGTLTLNGHSLFAGRVAADQLTVNGGSTLRLLAPVTANQPPTVALTAPLDGALFTAPATFQLQANAADADGSIARVEYYQGATKLGETFAAPHEFTLSNLTAGTYSYHARAIDNLGAATDSASVSITVQSPNLPPTVALTAPLDGALFTAPASFTLTADAADVDGTVARVQFYQGTTLLGEATASPYTLPVTGLTPGTYAFTARASDNAGASTTSTAVTATVVAPNQLPSVAIITPPDGATYEAPATLTFTANATDPDGSVAKVEYFEGAAKLGEATATPYSLTLTGISAGNHSYLARATDNTGASTDSAAVSITVTSPNQVPIVALTAPADGTVVTAPASIELTASASDPDGSVALVEFYNGATKLGQSTSAPYHFTWAWVGAGTYNLTARATDNAGAVASSAPIALTVQAPSNDLPLFANFEPSEGYQLGALNGQIGWTGTGSGDVVTTPLLQGTQTVLLGPAQPPAEVTRQLSANGTSVVWVDFYGRPAAGLQPETSSQYRTTEARLAFVQSGTQGKFFYYSGDSVGGGTWVASGYKTPLTPEGLAQTGLRITLREDFAAKTYDLYVGAAMIAADIPFADSTRTSIGSLTATGHATVATLFDDFLAAYDSPLFTDADHDGLDDAWETAHGLDPTRNDRHGDLDGDGLSNIQEYILGTNPNSNDSDGDGMPDKWEWQHGLNPLANDANADPDGDGVTNLQEFLLGTDPTVADAAPSVISGLRLWLKADAGITADGSGKITSWADQSSHHNNATQVVYAPYQPTVVPNAVNGAPVVRFDGVLNFLQLPNVMAGATAGEILVVLKTASATPSHPYGLWTLGGSLSYYPLPDGTTLEGFGSNQPRNGPPPAQPLNQYHLYNVSAASGTWTSRINGITCMTQNSNTVAFGSSPSLGYPSNGSSFAGDIAELIIFDHVLSGAERTAVTAYLNSRYQMVANAPAAPANLAATAASSSQGSLTWTGAYGTTSTVYEVERRQGGGSFALVATLADVSGYFDSGLTPGATYGYRVRARNYAGASSYSEVASVTLPASNQAVMPLSGLRLWLKAEAIATTGRVTNWPDLSGLGNSAMPGNPSRAPILVANGIDGKAAVQFNGSDSYLQLGNLMAGASAGEVFAVIQLGAPSPDGRNHSLWGLGSSGNYYTLGDGGIYESFGSTINNYAPAPAQDLTQRHLYNVSAQAGSWTSRFNGQVYNSVGSGNVVAFSTAPAIGFPGSTNFGVFSLKGAIAEIIIYDHALSLLDRESVNFYLNQKYHLSLGSSNALNNFAYDSDGDGLSNTQETALGTNPFNRDSDGDGIPDDWEVAHGLNPLDPADAALTDANGVTYLEKYYGDTGTTGATVQLKIYQPSHR